MTAKNNAVSDELSAVNNQQWEVFYARVGELIARMRKHPDRLGAINEGLQNCIEYPGDRVEVYPYFYSYSRPTAQIFQVCYFGQAISLGQEVRASMGCSLPQATRGVVVKIHRPHENGRTSDVIDVIWEGEICPTATKFKEIVP